MCVCVCVYRFNTCIDKPSILKIYPIGIHTCWCMFELLIELDRDKLNVSISMTTAVIYIYN